MTTEMEPVRDLGLYLTCLPIMLIGLLAFVLGYRFRGRVIEYGWLGAFLPGFIRKRIQE